MVYRRITQYWFNCDGEGCLEMDTYDGYSFLEALDYIRKRGWIVGKKHLCPRCREIMVIKGR